MGVQGLHDIAQQHVSGYPNAGQRAYYLYTPAVILVVSVLWAVGGWKLPTWARNLMPASTLLFLPFYLFLYTGGV
jgi:hypothetical protein